MILRTAAPGTMPPAVIVHGLADACAALAPGLPLTLLSARGAALYAGCGWWQALIAAARARFPEAGGEDFLDCADAPGRALEALRIGLKGIVLDPLCPAFPEIGRAAAAAGARLLGAAPAALDLGRPGAARALGAWLRQAPGRPGDSVSGIG
jgi:hypothetical protein